MGTEKSRPEQGTTCRKALRCIKGLWTRREQGIAGTPESERGKQRKGKWKRSAGARSPRAMRIMGKEYQLRVF